MSLEDWRGSAVAVTFIYMRCPLPQFCPMMDRRFAEVQRALAVDAGLARPRTAAVGELRSRHRHPRATSSAHATKLGADPAVWRFATAPRETVDRFAAAFGVNVVREKDRTITHNMRTAVIGPDGRVVAIHEGSDWNAAQVIDDLRRALAR